MNSKQVFDKFMSEVTLENVTVEKIISGHASESTNSAYFDLKLSDGSYYSLALSDHEADNHLFDLDDVFDLDDDVDFDLDTMSEELRNYADIDMLVDCENYGIAKINKYDFDVKSLIDKFDEAKAFVSDDFKIADAKLIEDNHFLKITYTDLKNEDSEVATYSNYVPKIADNCDIATIKYLLDSYDIDDVHEARRVYYQDGYPFSLTPKKEFDDDVGEMNDFDEIVTFNGQKFVAENDLLDQAINGDE